MLTAKEYSIASARLARVRYEHDEGTRTINRNAAIVERLSDVENERTALEAATREFEIDQRGVLIDSAVAQMREAVREASPLAVATVAALEVLCTNTERLRKIGKRHTDARENFRRSRRVLAEHAVTIPTPSGVDLPVDIENVLRYFVARFRLNGTNLPKEERAVQTAFPRILALPSAIEEEEPLECGE